MRKTGWVLLGAFLFLVVFWLGFMAHFPGAALSRMVESRVAALPTLRAKLSPASLGFTALHFDSLNLSYRGGGREFSLVTLKDVSISLTWRLWSGLPLRGSVGEHGRVELFAPWEGGETLEMSAVEVPLERVPALAILKPAQVRGMLTFSGSVKWPGFAAGRLKSLPEGTLTASGELLEIRQLQVLGSPLPPARLDSLEVQLTTGNRITVERFEFKGDLQGAVSGSIRPRLSDFSRSQLQLKVAASFRPEWLRRLGPLQALVQGFLKNGRLEGTVRGTLGSPKFQP